MYIIDSITRIPARISNWITLKAKHINLPKTSKIDGKLTIIGRAKEFDIGQNVRIVSNMRQNPLGGGYCYCLRCEQ